MDCRSDISVELISVELSSAVAPIHRVPAAEMLTAIPDRLLELIIAASRNRN
jgi:hypothetical protein